MQNVTCPMCGGLSNRLLAPGYFECTSSVVTDVVPPGAHGNASHIPITRTCGYRFQVGTAASAGAQCWCSMYAVGTCRTCGQALCGQHGSQDAGGSFLCNHHIQEDARRRAAAQAREDAEKRQRREEIARHAEQQRQEMLEARRQALPEFPVEGGAMAAELSAGLRTLVPDRARTFVVERRSLGRTMKVRGWGFRLGSEVKENARGGTYFRHRGLIVTDDDRAFIVTELSPSSDWSVGDHTHGKPPAETSGVGVSEVQTIVSQVLKWTGKPQGAGTTPARTEHLEGLVRNGRVSREEAERLAPSGAVSDAAWAAIRDR